MKIVKTNNALRIAVGPFYDVTNGYTPEVALTVTNSTCELFKDVDDGSAVIRVAITLTAAGGTNDMVHITDDTMGMYDLELTAAQLNFLGRARMVILDDDVHRPVVTDLLVVPANVFDSLVPGSDTLDVNVTSLSAGAIDSILDEPITEPAGVFAWASATLRNIVSYIGALGTNKITQTATTQIIRNRADGSNIGSSTVSDDGTTATRGSIT